MSKKAYYRLTSRETKNGLKNYVYIDDSVTPTAQDKEDIKLYISCGYVLKHKSAKKSAIAKERAKKTGFGQPKAKETETETETKETETKETENE